MREANVNNKHPNVVFNLERRQVNFKVDPNSLLTNLKNSGFGDLLIRAK